MKKNLLTALAVSLSLCGYAQTKGLNTIGLGVTAYKAKSPTEVNGIDNSQKLTAFSLGYGVFVSDNNKIGLDLSYTKNKSESYNGTINSIESKSFGLGLNYQHYYPLLSKLYAYAGAEATYSTEKTTYSSSTEERKTDYYTVGGHGGLTWFVSKRFAFETRLLTANAGFLKGKTIRTDNPNIAPFKTTTNSFSLNTAGVIDDLGFKIYLLF